MAVLKARYTRSGIFNTDLVTIEHESAYWRFEFRQWWKTSSSPITQVFAELRDDGGTIIRRKKLTNIKDLASLDTQVNVEFTPQDHPVGQGKTMMPARFLIVDRAGRLLFSRQVEQVVMLDPDMTIQVSMAVS